MENSVELPERLSSAAPELLRITKSWVKHIESIWPDEERCNLNFPLYAESKKIIKELEGSDNA